MSTAIDNAVQVLRQTNDELVAAQGEASDLSNAVNASNIRVSNAHEAFNAARHELANAALAAE